MEPMDISDSPKLEIEASSSTLEAVEETCLFSDPRPEASEVIANSLSAERNEEVMWAIMVFLLNWFHYNSV